MLFTICKYCPELKNCCVMEKNCERFRQVKGLLLEEVPILIREYHRVYTLVEEDLND